MLKFAGAMKGCTAMTSPTPTFTTCSKHTGNCTYALNLLQVLLTCFRKVLTCTDHSTGELQVHFSSQTRKFLSCTHCAGLSLANRTLKSRVKTSWEKATHPALNLVHANAVRGHRGMRPARKHTAANSASFIITCLLAAVVGVT